MMMLQNPARTTSVMAVNYYSVCGEIAEVVMSNEVINKPLGGSGVDVEVDECYLTRKYNKGRFMKTGTVTIVGLHKRQTDLEFHLQVSGYQYSMHN